MVWLAPGAEQAPAVLLSRQLEVVADAAELGIWSIDHEDARVEWNAQMFRIYGIERGRLPLSLREWRDTLVHPDDRALLTESRERSVREGRGAFETEFRIIRPDGTVRWVTSRSRRDFGGGPYAVIGIHLDTTELVTQRRIDEQVLHDKEIALRASQARSQFFARASHELRTPLNAVIGFAQLIEHDGVRAPLALQLERVAHIRSAGEHLLVLVDDALDLAAIEDGSLALTIAATPIDDMLQDVARWSESFARFHGVAIQRRPCGGTVLADARRLRQVLVNLVSNAIKFNRPGGTVWLGAVSRAEQGARRWTLSVRDNGTGIAAADRAQLFEPFKRGGADADRIEGAGLGLAIVARLTERMGGRVDFVSSHEHGSEFSIVLDAAQGPDESPPSARALPSASSGATSLCVLYIEDNPVNVLLVEGLVAQRPGVELHSAIDGVSGIALAVELLPQVVLIDMQLPDIDGLEVMRRLRAEKTLHDTRLIALSANGISENIRDALAQGFDDYWTKPIDFKLFLQRLDDLIEESRSIAR